jgi:hypothetical protein
MRFWQRKKKKPPIGSRLLRSWSCRLEAGWLGIDGYKRGLDKYQYVEDQREYWEKKLKNLRRGKAPSCKFFADYCEKKIWFLENYAKGEIVE